MTILQNNKYKTLVNPRILQQHVCQRLAGMMLERALQPLGAPAPIHASAVLLPLCQTKFKNHNPGGPCLVFNKRSAKVRQSGDLCFPGGGVGSWDKVLAGLQKLPWGHLNRWILQTRRGAPSRRAERRLALLLTTCLRESWEEMRLNPFRVTFLGPLPTQQLEMFQRAIHPMVGWVDQKKPFMPNWEVDRIVFIPLEHLFDHNRYGRYRLTFGKGSDRPGAQDDLPCFIHHDGRARETLWGASFRITMSFLSLCFDFSPPDVKNLPVVQRHLNQTYFNGS